MANRAPTRAGGAERRQRGLQLRRASAGAAQDDAGLGGLFGRAESRRRSDTAVQEGVTTRPPLECDSNLSHDYTLSQPTKPNNNQVPSPAVNGSSWGLLFQVHGKSGQPSSLQVSIAAQYFNLM